MKATNNVNRMQLSPVRKVLEKAKKFEKQGYDIVHFEIGEPDFDTPKEITEATIRSLRMNYTHYGPNRGILELRNIICEILKEDYSLFYNPDEEIIVTVGAAEALLLAIGAHISEEDEVIVFAPAFMNYNNLITLFGGKCIQISLKESENFQINPEILKNNINDRTKMIIINNPHNPTGTMFDEQCIKSIAEITKEHDLIIISDEIYGKIKYDKKKYLSIGSLRNMKQRTITINGFSKSHAMTGWRIGFLAAHKDLIMPMLKIHQYVTTCAPTFIQMGLAEGIRNNSTEKAVQEMIKIFATRRKLLIEGLNDIPGLSFNIPLGTFYLFLNVSSTGMNGSEFADRLLEEQGVALVPGEGFDEKYINFVRISYATSEVEINKGLQRIKNFISALILE